MGPIRAFGSSAPVACGDDDTTGYALFYCGSGRFIAYDDEQVMPEIYAGIGDFAVATMIATQYGLAAQHQLGLDATVVEQNLIADCMAGAWSASVFLEDRATGTLQLSPGDLDEAVAVLLSFASTSDEANSDQGAGFARVGSFRKGVLGGIDRLRVGLTPHPPRNCVDRRPGRADSHAISRVWGATAGDAVGQ